MEGQIRGKWRKEMIRERMERRKGRKKKELL
jgi:hypothetical protein